MPTTRQRSRNFMFTINNYTAETQNIIRKQWDCTRQAKYITWAREVGPTNGTPHLQGFIIMKDNYTIKRMQNLFQQDMKLDVGVAVKIADDNVKACIRYIQTTIKLDQGGQYSMWEYYERGCKAYIFSDIANECVCQYCILYNMYMQNSVCSGQGNCTNCWVCALRVLDHSGRMSSYHGYPVHPCDAYLPPSWVTRD